MRILVLICLASLVFSLQNHQQEGRNLQHSSNAHQSHDKENKQNQNANPNNFMQKDRKDQHQLMQEDENQDLRTKATIIFIVAILLCLIVKKCCEGRGKAGNTQQKYRKHKTNEKQQQKQDGDVSQQCPIIIKFDIQTIKSKYLVDNYGLKASRLSETCAQPIVLMQ